jgi:hypothetical protein
MNLRSSTSRVFRAGIGAPTAFGQNRRGALLFPRFMKAFAASIFCAAALPLAAFAQANYFATNGTEYAVIGSLPGDQVGPDAALATNGGFVVWHDNATDGDGWGVSARRLDSTLSGTLGTFRVNAQGSNDQQNARVAMLKNGGAAFVWEGGKRGYQHIYARFLSSSNLWLNTTDVAVSSGTNFQTLPDLATLSNGNVVVVWSSFNQVKSNSLQDVYGKIFSPAGKVVKNEFLVNQVTAYNQRTPVVAALKDGGFVVSWVSEQQRLLTPVPATNATASAMVNPSVDIYARTFLANGTAETAEFLVNSNLSPCANPSVAAASDGGFMVAWSSRDTLVYSNGWDVCARPFSAANVGGPVVTLNSRVLGSQYAPRLSSIGLDYFAVWTSLGQDGSREGVYGRFFHHDGTMTSDEFGVNTTAVSQQLEPVAASDGVSQFVAVWTSYTAGPDSFDLFAQRYVNVNAVLQPMPAPFVHAPFNLVSNVYQPQLEVSWAPLAGISVSSYEIYVDGGAAPAAVTASNLWVMTAANGLTANSTRSFQVAYVKTDGSRSPLSAAAEGSTWDGLNWGGIPYEWMTAYFGDDISQWPAVGSSVGGGGPKLSQVFLSGGNPLDSDTWLKTHLKSTGQGLFLTWNTQRGFRYQVQASTNFATWSNVGSPRFAAGNNDSIYVGGSTTGFYRVVLLR